MKIDDESLQQAIRTTIAEKLLSGIQSEHRDALLTKSIEAALKDWSFKNAIEKVVAEQAAKQAQAMMDERRWQDEIAAAVEAGFKDFIGRLQHATYEFLVEGFAGKEGSYCYTGALLKHLRKEGR